jgi:hypothetical protein
VVVTPHADGETSEAGVTDALLGDLAAAAVHVGEQAIIHNRAEVVGSVPGLLETLAPGDVFAYMLMPDFQPDGSIRLPVATTREEMRAVYEIVRGRSDVLSEEPIVELRTPWYALWESVSTGRLKGGTEEHTHPLVVLSPAGPVPGITGEMIWPLLPREMLGTGEDTTSEKDDFVLRRELRLRHMRWMDAVAAGDVDGIVAELDDGVASAVRDYAGSTAGLLELVGKDGHAEHYAALFARYEVISAELLHRVTQPWYVFAETRWTVRDRSDDGRPLAFHTAQIHAPSKSGTFIANLGWGTDPS